MDTYAVDEAKPEQSEPRSSPKDRRKTSRLLVHWQTLRGGRPYPALADVDPAALGLLWRFCFLVRPSPMSLIYTHVGSALRTSYGVDGSEGMPETVRAMVEDPYHRAIQRMEAILTDGTIHNRWGDELRFRSSALPLSDDQETVSHVLGLVDFITVRRELAGGIKVETACAPSECDPAA